MIRIARSIVLLVVIVGMCLAVTRAVDQWNANAAGLTGGVRFAYLLGAAGVYGIGLLFPGWILYRTLGAFSIPCTFGRAVAAQLVGHAGKYIPGKALVIVLRVNAIVTGESRASRHVIKLASASVFFETLLMMSVGAAFSAILIANTTAPTWIKASAIAIGVAAVVPTLPPVMRRLCEKLVASEEPDATPMDLHAIRWKLLAESVLLSLVSWLCIGASFTMIVLSLAPSVDATLFSHFWDLGRLCSAAIALGMVLGFASLLPGGAGVREWATLLVLTPTLGPTHALLAVVAARLLFILVEALMAATCYLGLRRVTMP